MATRRRNRRERRAIVSPQQVTFTVPTEIRFATWEPLGDGTLIKIGFGIPDVTSAAEALASGTRLVDTLGNDYFLGVDTVSPQQINLVATLATEPTAYLLGYICVTFTDALAPPIILDLNGIRPDPA